MKNVKYVAFYGRKNGLKLNNSAVSCSKR